MTIGRRDSRRRSLEKRGLEVALEAAERPKLSFAPLTMVVPSSVQTSAKIGVIEEGDHG